MDPIARLAHRIRGVERLAFRAATQPQLAHSSIEDGAIQSVEDGTLKAIIGKQFDGTQAIAIVNGPPPPTPSQPIVTPALEGAIIRWDGTFAGGAICPMDFARVEAHVSTDPDFTAEFAETLKVSFETPRGGQVFVSLVPATYYVKLVARNSSGGRSIVSASATVIPQALSDSLPEASDGLPPTSSPTPTAQGGVQSIFVGWDLIANHDPVTYEVHVSTTSDFAPDSSTLSGETSGNLHVIRTLPGSTTRVDHATTYYIKLIAKDADGAAAPGAQASVQPVQITTVDIADDAITPVKIPDEAITAAKIAADAVTSVQLALDAVTSENIADGAVGTVNLSDDAVTGAKIADGAVDTAQIALDAITSDVIAAGAVTSTEIDDDAVTSPKIVAGAVTAGKIAADAVTANEIAAGAVTAVEIAAGAVTTEKLTIGSLGDDMIANGNMEDANSADPAIPARFYRREQFGAMSYEMITDLGASSSGSRCLAIHKLPAAGSGDYAGIQTELIPVIAGRTYDIVVRRKSSGGNASHLLRALGFDSHGTSETIIYDGWETVAPSAWGDWRITIAVPAGTFFLSVVSYHYGPLSDANTTLFLDEFEMRPVVVSAQIADGAITADKIVAGAIQVGGPKTTFAAGYDPSTKETPTGAQAKADAAHAASVAEALGAGGLTWTRNMSGGVTEAAGAFAKTTGSTAGWDAQVYSTEGYATGCALSFAMRLASSDYQMVGLNSDPATSASYETLDFSWYAVADGSWQIYESGAPVAGLTLPPRTAGDVAAITHDGVTVRYFLNGVLYREVARDSATPLYFDSTFYNVIPTGGIRDVRFAPLASAAYKRWAPVGQTTIDGGKITTDSITANQIAGEAITASELAADSVIATKIAAGAVVAGKIAADAVTANEIAANAVTVAELAANAVTAEKIVSDSITANEIAANAITANELAANAVTADKIFANAITADKLSSLLVLASRIEVGSAISIDPSTGITINLANGGYIKLPANGNPAEFKRVILQATELTVEDKLTINGIDNKVAGALSLNQSVSVPSVMAAVTNISDQTPTSTSATTADMGLGLSASAGTYLTHEFAQWVFRTDGAAIPIFFYDARFAVYKIDKSTGAKTLVGTNDVNIYNWQARSGDTQPAAPATPTILSAYDTDATQMLWVSFSAYSHPGYVPGGAGGSLIWGTKTEAAFKAMYYKNAAYSPNLVKLSLTGTGDPAFWTDDTNIYIGYVDPTSNQVMVDRYAMNLSGGVNVMTSTATLPGVGFNSMLIGAADFGSSRYVLASGATFYVFNGSTRDTTAEWAAPEAVKGFVYDSGRFRALGVSNKIWKFSTLVTSTSRSFTYTWYNATGGTESTVSPAAAVTQNARSWIQVTTSAIPTGTTTSYPDSVRIYEGNHRQTALAVGAISTIYEIPTNTGAAAPTVDGYAALGNAGTVKSSKTDSRGPIILLKGDGSGRAGPFAWDANGDRAFTEYDSGWIYVNGQGTNPALVAGTVYGGVHGMPRFRRIGDVVYMEGLINSVPAAPGVLFTLPVGFRPDGDIIPPGNASAMPEGSAIRILANGQVQVSTGVTGYASLVCQFPIASAANPWHLIGDPGEPAFGAGWSNLGGGWQTARYMKIGDFVYLQGVVQRTSGSGTTIFTLPAACQNTNGNSHTAAAMAPAMAGSDFGLNIGSAVVSRATGSNTGYVSLAGIRFYAGPANDPKWRRFRGGVDGYWTGANATFGGGWPVPAIRRDGKIVHLEGLLNITTANIFAKLPYGYAPGQLLIHSALNATARRLDVSSPNEDSGANTASSLQAFATGVVGLTHSWVVGEPFEDTGRWTHEV